MASQPIDHKYFTLAAACVHTVRAVRLALGMSQIETTRLQVCCDAIGRWFIHGVLGCSYRAIDAGYITLALRRRLSQLV